MHFSGLWLIKTSLICKWSKLEPITDEKRLALATYVFAPVTPSLLSSTSSFHNVMFCTFLEHQWRESCTAGWSTGKVFIFCLVFYFVFVFYSLHELEVLSTISCFQNGWQLRCVVWRTMTSERYIKKKKRRAPYVASVFISYKYIYININKIHYFVSHI